MSYDDEELEATKGIYNKKPIVIVHTRYISVEIYNDRVMINGKMVEIPEEFKKQLDFISEEDSFTFNNYKISKDGIRKMTFIERFKKWMQK